MNTITLTMEATPENLERLSRIFSETEPASIEEMKKSVEPVVKSPKAKAPKTAPKDPAAEEAMKEPGPTIDKTALRTLGLEITKAGKADRMKAILGEFGAAKLSQVKEEDYEALYKKLQEEVS